MRSARLDARCRRELVRKTSGCRASGQSSVEGERMAHRTGSQTGIRASVNPASHSLVGDVTEWRRMAHGYRDSGCALQDPLQSWTSRSRLCLDVSGCWHEVVAVPGQRGASSAWQGGAQVVFLAPGPAGEDSLDFTLFWPAFTMEKHCAGCCGGLRGESRLCQG